ncbi:MAG: type II toxin-antitoxin system PemK/MazF family toxin [Rhizobiales bacterium]|nr:type II toxin-antitoxin system PemK/MazF family toxin [Hyphomicrobiales bacterium]
MICERWQTVAVPFPFMERPAMKRRPALILSHRPFNDANNHTIMAMITAAMLDKWPSDHAIKDLAAAGLKHRCVIRWKVFTLPNEFIVKVLGKLGNDDQQAIESATAGILCAV